MEDSHNPRLVLLASGSEVKLALDSQKLLEQQGIATRVVSVPCFDLLLAQDEAYRQQLFGTGKVLAIEASRALEWYVFAHDVIGMNGFGASGKGETLFERFGFSVENIINRAKMLCH